jgi:hypothetical protein
VRTSLRAAKAWIFVWVCLSSVYPVVRADELSTALYIRTDTDHTTVVSPRARASLQVADTTRVDATYAADIWTSASVDIRASASVRPVTEQRDELDLALSHELGDLNLRASYRFSTEHDYLSHGLSLGAAYSFANNAATLDFNLRAIADTVGRAGDPNFSRGLGTFNASVGFTQVLDRVSFLTLTYELAHAQGYQSSPYRFVGEAGTGFGCVGSSLCLHELVPDGRTRHAFALLVRRAFSDVVSLGLTYRLYLDDWSLLSHTLLGELGLNAGTNTMVMIRYRYYTQNAVSFYQRVYETLSEGQYRTRDRELSPLSYHRAGAELTHDFPLERGGRVAATLIVSGNYYNYADFVGLDKILALEISAALLLEI